MQPPTPPIRCCVLFLAARKCRASPAASDGRPATAVCSPPPWRSLTANNWQATAGNYVLSYTCSNQAAAQTYTLNAAGQIEAGGPSTGLCLSTTGTPNNAYPVRVMQLEALCTLLCSAGA